MVFREIVVYSVDDAFVSRAFIVVGEVSKPHGSNCVAVSTWPLEAMELGMLRHVCVFSQTSMFV